MFGPVALLTMIVVHMVLYLGVMGMVNTVGHLYGRKPHPDVPGYDAAWLAIPLLGHGYHNSHHAHPAAARTGPLDPIWPLLRVLGWAAAGSSSATAIRPGRASSAVLRRRLIPRRRLGDGAPPGSSSGGGIRRHRPQAGLVDLADRVAGDLVDQVDEAGCGVVGHARPDPLLHHVALISACGRATT